MFFWKNGGRGPGYEPGYGLIQSHIRNACKQLSPKHKKFVHKKKPKQIDNVPIDIVQKAQDCSCKDPVSTNFNFILKCMNETHDAFAF